MEHKNSTIEQSVNNISYLLETYLDMHLGMILEPNNGMIQDVSVIVTLVGGEKIEGVFVRSYMPFGVILDVLREIPETDEFVTVGTRLIPWHRIEDIYAAKD